MLTRLYDFGWLMGRITPRFKHYLVKTWYEFISHLDQNGEVLFLNYGYAPVTGNSATLELADADETHRYQIQLYHHVASALDLNGLDVIEVGCGRGGGASFVMRYLHPHTLTAVDLAENAIVFCARHYSTPGLRFQPANAEALPFADEAFDVVLNVESSANYAHVDRFVREAFRVLRHGGYLLWTDFRTRSEYVAFYQMLREAGFEVRSEELVTANILTALTFDEQRKLTLMRAKAPRIFHGVLQEFIATPGTRTYEGFRTGNLEYWYVVLYKE